MKKILGVLTIIVLLVSVCFYFFPKQPKNIFDEIYQETEKTYLGNNVFNKLKDVEAHKYQEYSDDSRFYPSVAYEENALPDSYEKIAIDFNFKSTFQSKLYPTCRQEPPINSRIMEFFGMDSGLTGST